MKIALMGINRDKLEARKHDYGYRNWANFFAHHIYRTNQNPKYGCTMGELKLTLLDLDDKSITDSFRMGTLSTHNYEMCILNQDEYQLIMFNLLQI